MRSRMPAIYNPMRVHEQPIPRIIGPVAIDDENERNFENSADESNELTDNDYSESINMLNETFEGEEEANGEVKPPVFEEICVTTDDANAFDSVFDNESIQSDDEAVDDPLQNGIDAINDGELTGHNDQLESHDEPIEPDLSNQAMLQIDYSDDVDDVLCFYNTVEDFRPIPEYIFQIKANDLLCNNRPFKQNVRKFSFIREIKLMFFTFKTTIG